MSPARLLGLRNELKSSWKHPELILSFHQLSSSDIKNIVQGLTVNENITHLDVSDNQISWSEGAQSLAQYIKHNRNLRIVEVGANPLTFGVSDLIEALKANPSIQFMGMKGQWPLCDALKDISEVLRIHSKLYALDLEGIFISQDGGIMLANALKVNTTLTYLNLGRIYSYISSHISSFIACLSQVLTDNKTLEVLILDKIGLNDKQMTSLAHGLSHNSGIRELSLKRNRFGPPGLTAFRNIFWNNRTIEKVDLSENNIPAVQLVRLAVDLNYNPVLRKIEIENNHYTHETLRLVEKLDTFHLTLIHNPLPHFAD